MDRVVHCWYHNKKVELHHGTGQKPETTRTNGGSRYLLFHHPLERCQIDPWMHLFVLTIPGQAAGLMASTDGGDGDPVEPSGNYRQCQVVKRKCPLPHSCLSILFSCR